MKKVSVVIVTYNSEKHIFDCLSALYKYNDIGDFLEVIIVDNCSNDFLSLQQKLLEKYNSRLRIISNTKNGGYGQGNNVGIKFATAPIIMIMNPDVRLVQPIFKDICNTFEDESVALYGFQQLNSNGQRGFSIAWSSYWHPIVGLTLTSICNRFGLYFSRYMYVAGACFCLRKSFFEKIGMFDENIFMYMEEDDIHYRLSKLNNIKLLYNDNMCYLHLHGLYSKVTTLDDCSVELLTFKNKLYLNTKRGFTRKQILNRELFYIRYYLYKEMLFDYFNKKDKRSNHIIHLRILLQKLLSINIY